MKITVETKIVAPIDDVWHAWTTPDDIKQWNTASADWHTTNAAVDLRVGGAFSSRMESKDGSMGFDFAGVYTKIVERQTIECSFGDRVLLVEFIPGPDYVTVRETFDAETTNPIEQQRQGWQSSGPHVRRSHSRRSPWHRPSQPKLSTVPHRSDPYAFARCERKNHP